MAIVVLATGVAMAIALPMVIPTVNGNTEYPSSGITESAIGRTMVTAVELAKKCVNTTVIDTSAANMSIGCVFSLNIPVKKVAISSPPPLLFTAPAIPRLEPSQITRFQLTLLSASLRLMQPVSMQADAESMATMARSNCGIKRCIVDMPMNIRSMAKKMTAITPLFPGLRSPSAYVLPASVRSAPSSRPPQSFLPRGYPIKATYSTVENSKPLPVPR